MIISCRVLSVLLLLALASKGEPVFADLANDCDVSLSNHFFNSNSPVLALDPTKSRILYWNGEAENTFQVADVKSRKLIATISVHQSQPSTWSLIRQNVLGRNKIPQVKIDHFLFKEIPNKPNVIDQDTEGNIRVVVKGHLAKLDLTTLQITTEGLAKYIFKPVPTVEKKEIELFWTCQNGLNKYEVFWYEGGKRTVEHTDYAEVRVNGNTVLGRIVGMNEYDPEVSFFDPVLQKKVILQINATGINNFELRDFNNNVVGDLISNALKCKSAIE